MILPLLLFRRLSIVYYELQSISFADRIYRPVIDQLKHYCVRSTRFVLGVLCIIGCLVQLIWDVFLNCIFVVYTHLPRFEALAYVLLHFDALTHMVILVSLAFIFQRFVEV